jgi:hypothetical protein
MRIFLDQLAMAVCFIQRLVDYADEFRGRAFDGWARHSKVLPGNATAEPLASAEYGGTPRSFTVYRRDERFAACLLGQGARNSDSYAGEPLPRPADKTRQHASAGCAVAMGRLRALPPRSGVECGLLWRCGAGACVRPAHGLHSLRDHRGVARPNWQERQTQESLTH